MNKDGWKVLSWDVDIRCRSRSQAHALIKKILSEELDYDVSLTKMGGSWTVQIVDMSWGDNLKTIGKLAKECDVDY